MAKKKPEKKPAAKKPAAKKPAAKKPDAKKPAAKKPVAKVTKPAAKKPVAKVTKPAAKKPAKKPVKKPAPVVVALDDPPPPPSPQLFIDTITPNPDFPHTIDKLITGTTVGTNATGISWEIKLNGTVVASGNATSTGSNSYSFTVPANTLSDGVSNYQLHVTKQAVLPAQTTLNTNG